jgi:cytochrome bd-type quinol oxidase subunit 1
MPDPVVPQPAVPAPVVAVVHSYTATFVGVLFVILSIASNPDILAGITKAIAAHDAGSIAALVGLVAGQLLIILGRGPLSGAADTLARAGKL